MGASHTTVQQTTFANRLQKRVGHPRLRVLVMRVAARAPTPNVGKSRAEQLGVRVKVVGYVDG